MQHLYSGSWELYKAITENFQDDIEYYRQFVGEHHALELFAGFGRVTNQLVELGASIETVEILPEFSQFIDVPVDQKHICNVLQFKPQKKFSRIYAAYNSFCLITEDSELKKFIQLLDSWLDEGGKISLNYYHPDFWADAHSFSFFYNKSKIKYEPSFDLSERKRGIGFWIDNFNINGELLTHKYETKIYESVEDIHELLKGTSLELEDCVKNFEIKEPLEPGWIDFLIKKK